MTFLLLCCGLRCAISCIFLWLENFPQDIHGTFKAHNWFSGGSFYLFTWKKETTKKSSKTNSKMKRKIVGINAFGNRCHDRMWNTPVRLNSIFLFDPPYLIAIPKVLMLCYLEVIRALICFTPMIKTYLGTLCENWNYGLELKSRRCLFNCICDILTKQCNLLLDRLEPLIWKRGKRDFWCEGRWRITALSKVFLWAGLFMCGKAAARTMLAGVLTKPFYSVDIFCKNYDLPLQTLIVN